MESIANWALPVLRMMSVALTGVLGVVALLINFRRKDGKVSKWGKWSLVGVIASTLVGAATTGFETVREKVQAQETAQENLVLSQKTNRIIQDINRSLNPLKEVQFALWLDVPVEQCGLQEFQKRVQEWLWNNENGKRKTKDKYVSVVRGDSGGAKRVEVNGMSALFPGEEEETMGYFAVRYVDLVVQFYRRRVLPEAFQGGMEAVEQYVRPDLEIDVTTSGVGNRDLSLVYDTETGELQVRFAWMKSETKYWKSNGTILSVPDLEESQVFVFIRSMVVPDDEESPQRVLRARQGLRLNRLMLKVGDGREFWLTRGEMKEGVTPDSLRYYERDVVGTM